MLIQFSNSVFWLVSTERYGSVQYIMIRDGTPWSSLRFHRQQYPYLIGVVYAGK